MAQKDLKIGIWEEEIRNALIGAYAAIIILTPNSIHSKWVMCEAGACWALNKPLIPVINYIKPEDLPQIISKYQAIPFNTTESRDNFYRLVNEIIKI